jgi:Virulence factor BrkB
MGGSRHLRAGDHQDPGPDRGILGALLWIATSMLFSFYVATFDSYNKTYGSLGAGVGFMVWLWISYRFHSLLNRDVFGWGGAEHRSELFSGREV